ncbi:hypothetical protein FA13DRAFT_1723397 [Coprinellus micaceus]|uniref:Uncharacterized protein n=1 Tax=Coprinellus micaceus TaxID=71717 RepID=A0A4Y7R610_COPMI|nr:hypothetical protein FA13DRAFT_1723397 [Coprinellus micaceus]
MPKTPTLKLESASQCATRLPTSFIPNEAGGELWQLSLPSSPTSRLSRWSRSTASESQTPPMSPGRHGAFKQFGCKLRQHPLQLNRTMPQQHAGVTSAFQTPQRVPSIAVQRSTEKGVNTLPAGRVATAEANLKLAQRRERSCCSSGRCHLKRREGRYKDRLEAKGDP